ncbi:hypothetical protein C5Y96_25940 [Blastopirellula marina]|uniref:Uncharacterized protein n=1 Tax=Blastopirellula marina TaxID=124 RepID=A0A2S8EZM2_9BACT|nr:MULTISPECIES: hypothetical protein [Pirellulaceae]PQO25337.1 hypothetical protein C5Y96_25940 [Blastopirellula marina]RCS41770.1 hypothetical protein DTL36_25990 [Bremerella cremea]
MFVHTNLRLALAMGLVAAVTTTTWAAPPWANLIPFQRVEADAEKSYELTEDQGPWLIMATSFSGPGAEKDANDLVLELRKDYGLEAYTWHQNYDYTDTVVGKGYDRYGGPKKMKYMNDVSFTSYAVMVGNFQTVEESGVEKTLSKIKTAKPKVFSASYTVKNDTIKTIRQRLREAIDSEDDKEKGPMGNAFVTRNPLLPEEYFRPKGIDDLVLKMNKDSQNSLLNCPGKYTVRVATFRGAVELDQKKIDEIEKKNIVSGTRLAVAAEKAEKLADALRKQGVEAYTFHDRSESIVTVGSFETVGTPRRDGKIEINPQVKRIMDGYKGGTGTATIEGGTAPSYKPRSLNGIIFDVQPLPVEVPKVSIAADYARRPLR